MSDTNHKYITVNDLPNATTVLPNDLIFVSRRDPTTQAIMSYSADLYNIKKDISVLVANYTKKSLHDPFAEYYDNSFVKLQGEWHNVSTDLSRLSTNLTSEWNSLSTQLTTQMNKLSTDMYKLSSDLCTKISTFLVCVEISAQNQWAKYSLSLENKLSNTLADLSATIAANYVSVYNNQTIYGQKTFKEDIIGTALSAKWI